MHTFLLLASVVGSQCSCSCHRATRFFGLWLDGNFFWGGNEETFSICASHIYDAALLKIMSSRWFSTTPLSHKAPPGGPALCSGLSACVCCSQRLKVDSRFILIVCFECLAAGRDQVKAAETLNLKPHCLVLETERLACVFGRRKNHWQQAAQQTHFQTCKLASVDTPKPFLNTNTEAVF